MLAPSSPQLLASIPWQRLGTLEFEETLLHPPASAWHASGIRNLKDKGGAAAVGCSREVQGLRIRPARRFCNLIRKFYLECVHLHAAAQPCVGESGADFRLDVANVTLLGGVAREA